MSRWTLTGLSLPLLMLASAPAGAKCLAIIGATVYLPSGPGDGVNVVVAEGKLHSVGPQAPIPVDCERIDGKGKVVTPGMVETMSDLGLVEVSLEAFTVDSDRYGRGSKHTTDTRATHVVADAYNPRSTLIPVTRLEGVTSALTVPSGGIVAGQAAWVDLAGATQAEAVKRRSVAMMAAVGGTGQSRAASLMRLLDLLREAKRYPQIREAWEKNQFRKLEYPWRQLEALQPVVTGELPLVVRVERAADIEALLRVTGEVPALKLIVAGGGEAWLVKDELAARKVPVIMLPTIYGPGSFDQIHARRDAPKLLHEAGVPLIVSSFQAHNSRTLRQLAGNAVREGLDHSAAVRAVTQTPAEVFGMKDHGRIAKGSVANLVVWSGDPLELSTHVERLIIGGRDVALESRQTKLRDRYRRMPGRPGPLPLP